MSHSCDPDALYDDAPIARIEITCRRNGAMSAVKGHHARRGRPLIIAANDLALPA